MAKRGRPKGSTNKPKGDVIHSPKHYASGDIECIAAIKASMSAVAYKGYLKGNIQKYVWRYEQKGKLDDLRKAEVYLGWLISEETPQA
jgi:hypothetical protein